ncbi:hypothetical protein TI03_01225 [Achromatium sp. WMS1]|nr:hypothetical protein TI03_01225 [Achromatium sp. WMS1]
MKKYYLLLIYLLSWPIIAANFNIWPMKVLLWPEHYADNVHITNNGTAPVNLQVLAKSWDIDENGKFIETDTGDFVFFPRLLTLPPGASKNIRVGYQGNFPSLEKPYRLYIEELPPILTVEQQRQRTRMGVQYVLRLSLPLFVMPAETPPTPELTIDAVKLDRITIPQRRTGARSTSALKIGIRATGTHHVQIEKLELELLNSAGRIVGRGETNPHILRILPKRRVFVDVPLNAGICTRSSTLLATVYVADLRIPYKQRITLTSGSCRMR